MNKRPKFEAGEQVLWEGRPWVGYEWSRLKEGKRIGGMVAVVVGLSAVIATIANLQDMPGAASVIAVSAATYLITAGLEAALADIFKEAHASRVTQYLLTNRYAYIGVDTAKTGTFRRFHLTRDAKIELDAAAGAVHFQWRPASAPFPAFIWRRKTMEPVGFTRLSDAPDVYDRIRAMQRELGEPERT